MRSKHKVLIVLILVLLVVFSICMVTKTDLVEIILSQESVDLNDYYEVMQAINKELCKYYGTKRYHEDTPEVRKEKLLAILEKLEDKGLIEEGSISSDSRYIYYHTATGDQFFLEYLDPDPNHN